MNINLTLHAVKKYSQDYEEPVSLVISHPGEEKKMVNSEALVRLHKL